LLTFWVDDIIT